MQQNNSDMLRTQPIHKLLVQLCLPMITANLITLLYNIVDRIYIGHMPDIGHIALTGVGITMPIIACASSFAALICGGGAPRASFALGQGNRCKAEQLLGNCLMLQVLTALAVTGVLLRLGEPMLPFFGASEETIGYASDYLGIYALGTIFVQLTIGLNGFITAQGFSLIAMLTVLVGAALNIALDPLFIFVLNMGVRGAALATVLSQAISCLWVLHFLCGKKTELRIRRQHLRLRWGVIHPCIALGTAMFIIQFSEGLISLAFNTTLSRWGGDIAVGAMTVIVSIQQFLMQPLSGISQGAQPIACFNYGARDPVRVRRNFRLQLTVSLAYSVLLWLVAQCFPEKLVGIFTHNPDLIAFSAQALRRYSRFFFLMGIQLTCQTHFIAIGQAKSSILVACMRKFVLILPLIFLLPLLLEDKAMAVYAAEPIADLFAVSFTIWLFHSRFRRAMAAIEPSAAAAK